MKEKEIIPGTPVIFWGVIKSDGSKSEPLQTVITSEPWEVGGQMCCKVKGKSGCVSIKHLDYDDTEDVRDAMNDEAINGPNRR